MEKKETCPNCDSKNTMHTPAEYLTSMRDYFCNDCGVDFYNAKQREMYEKIKED